MKTREQLEARLREIQEKYTVFHQIYGQWLRFVDGKTRELGLNSYKERNKLPAYHKGLGISTGLDVFRHNLTNRKPRIPADEVIKILTDQANEPSATPEFRAGVQMVLDDVLAETIEPFQPALFRLEEVAG